MPPQYYVKPSHETCNFSCPTGIAKHGVKIQEHQANNPVQSSVCSMAASLWHNTLQFFNRQTPVYSMTSCAASTALFCRAKDCDAHALCALRLAARVHNVRRLWFLTSPICTYLYLLLLLPMFVISAFFVDSLLVSILRARSADMRVYGVIRGFPTNRDRGMDCWCCNRRVLKIHLRSALLPTPNTHGLHHAWSSSYPRDLFPQKSPHDPQTILRFRSSTALSLAPELRSKQQTTR